MEIRKNGILGFSSFVKASSDRLDNKIKSPSKLPKGKADLWDLPVQKEITV